MVLLVLMILRVYAMYNRSRRILTTLFIIYIPVLVSLSVASAVYIATTYVSVYDLEVVDVKFCLMTYQGILPTFILDLSYVIPQFILSILLCTLTVAQSVRASLQMHQAVRWRSNQYLELFTRESILVFTINLCYCVTYLCTGIALPRDRGAPRHWVWCGFTTHIHEP